MNSVEIITIRLNMYYISSKELECLEFNTLNLLYMHLLNYGLFTIHIDMK
jgi:hypothetical protein